MGGGDSGRARERGERAGRKRNVRETCSCAAARQAPPHSTGHPFQATGVHASSAEATHPYLLPHSQLPLPQQGCEGSIKPCGQPVPEFRGRRGRSFVHTASRGSSPWQGIPGEVPVAIIPLDGFDNGFHLHAIDCMHGTSTARSGMCAR